MTTATATRIEKRVEANGRVREFVRIGDVEVTFSQRDWRDRRSYESKARVYGAIDALAPELDALEPQYVAFTDENSTGVQRVQEKMWLAWRDATKAVVAERLAELVAQLQDVELLNMPADNSVKFSYKAGCSCGCSPGFVLADRVRFESGWSGNVDLFLARVEES